MSQRILEHVVVVLVCVVSAAPGFSQSSPPKQTVAAATPVSPPKPLTAAHTPSDPATIWAAILELFQWSGEAPITRGPPRPHDQTLGDLWTLEPATGKFTQLTQGEQLRSPLVTAAAAFALDAAGLRVFKPDITDSKLVRLPVEAGSVAQLLGFRDARILALHGSCIVSFRADGSAWEVKLCALSEVQVQEVILRSRACADRLLDERLEGEPVARIDVTLRSKGSRVSQNLTRIRAARFNTDPRFFADCSRVVFVSR